MWFGLVSHHFGLRDVAAKERGQGWAATAIATGGPKVEIGAATQTVEQVGKRSFGIHWWAAPNHCRWKEEDTNYKSGQLFTAAANLILRL